MKTRMYTAGSDTEVSDFYSEFRECGRLNDYHASQGFTLLELLVVMTLAALLMVVVPANFSAVAPHLEQQAKVKQFVFALRSARGLAIRESREVSLMLDKANRQYSLSGAKTPESLPKGLSIEYLAPFPPTPHNPLVEIHFFSDGSSTGGNIEMLSDELRYKITIDWLTGKINYQEQDRYGS